MDEITVRIVVQIPENMVEFLERLATRRGLKSRAKAIRFCIREEMKRSEIQQAKSVLSL